LKILSGRTRNLRQRLLEAIDSRARIAWLTRWLTEMSDNAMRLAPIAHAAARLANVPMVSRIGDACRELGMSPRRFGTLFREHVGMSPKRYARLQRFRAVVDSAQIGRSIEWSRVAADCGFYDQPHLVREFRDFSGMTPSAYVARRGPYVNHVPLDEI
jgi:AraC-like DNA-binding protein